MYISHFDRFCLSNRYSKWWSQSRTTNSIWKGLFSTDPYKTGYYQFFKICIKLEIKKMVLLLICIALIILLFFDYLYIFSREMSACPYFLFFDRVSLLLFICRAFISIIKLGLSNLCCKYFLQAFIYECWFQNRFLKLIWLNLSKFPIIISEF